MNNKLIKILSIFFCVLLLSCSFFTLFVSAANITTVSFTNPNGLPYDDTKSLSVVYDFANEAQAELILGNTTNVQFYPVYSEIITIADGMLQFADSLIDVGVEYDGSYVLLGSILADNYSDGGINVMPVVEGAGYQNGDFMNTGFAFYDSVPDSIFIGLEESSNNALVTMTFLLVKYVEPTVVENVGSVWSGIMLWLVSAFNSVVGIFWTGTQLTLIGTLALVGTAIALCLLIYNKIKDFLHLQ